jgi:hypothetical protein
VNAAGNAYVTGLTISTDFPTANAFQPTKGGGSYVYSVFLTKFSSDGASLVYSTYLGGSGGDSGNGIAVDAAGNAYVTGFTFSSDFPTANAFQPSNQGAATHSANAFVTKVLADGASLLYSTYLGGSGHDFGFGDSGQGIAVDAAGDAYVAGYTYSTDFPTASAFQLTKGGGSYVGNAFVTKFAADGTSLVYSSYLGGSGYGNGYGDGANGIAVDGTGDAYVEGGTDSTDFPTVNGFQPLKGDTGAFQSTDGGTTWHAIDGAAPDVLTNADIRSLTVDPASPTTLYVGTNGGGVFKTTDAGITWAAINNGLTNAKVQALRLDPINSATVYVGTNGGGVFKSIDGGSSWITSDNGLTNLNVQTLAVDPTNSATLYIGTNGGGVFKSIDGGASWTPSNSGLTKTNIRSLAVDPANSATLYAATDNGTYKSLNGGTTWSKTGLSGQVQALALDPTAPSTVYAGDLGTGTANAFVAKIS